MITITWTPYALVPIVAAVMAAAIARYAWRWRASPGGWAFALLLFAAAEWAFFSGLENLVAELWAKVFLAKLQYFGIASVAPLWLLFTLGYTQPERRLSARNRLALWIIPALTVLFALTNEWHGWIWSQVVPASGAPGSFAVYHHGPWFYLAAAYSYLLLLAGSAFLVWAIVRTPRLFRHQAGALLLGLAIPWVSNGLYLAGVPLVPGIDPTPLAFVLTGLIYAWSIYRLRLLDLRPIARAAVVHNLPDGVIALDEQRRVIDINPAAQAVIGRSANEVIGRPVDEVWPAYRERLASADPGAVQRTDLALNLGDQPRYFEVLVSPLRRGTAGPAGWTIVLHDVTERRQAEDELRQSREQLRDLAARQEATREEERARIAREIHDELGQQLTALRMALGQLARSLPAAETHQAEQLRDLNSLANEMIQTVRRIATELRPAVLDDFGLVAAVEWYLRDFERRSGIHCQLVTRGELARLAPDRSVALFRIVQEALTNVARHAQASQVIVRLLEEGGYLVLEVCDNGRGIDLAEAAKAVSFGIAGMRERVRLLNGELLISGTPGQGTTVRVELRGPA